MARRKDDRRENWSEKQRRKFEKELARALRSIGPEPYLMLAKHLARKGMRKYLTGPAKKAARKQIRGYQERARKRFLGVCPICGKGATGHSHKFTQRNSQQLRKRLDARGIPESNLRKGRLAA